MGGYIDGHLLTDIAKVLFDLVDSPTIAHLEDNLLGKVCYIKVCHENVEQGGGDVGGG